MELDNRDYFRVNAYRRAAKAIRETSGPVAKLALEGKATELPGIGKTIEEKIVQAVDKGEIEALAKRRGTVPEEVITFIRLPGLGPKTARRIWKELGITTVAGLREGPEGHQLRDRGGLGARSEEKILAALAKDQKAEGPPRSLLGTALPRLRAVADALK